MPGRYYGYYYYDPTYMLIVISALISLFAQFLVNSRFSKYSRVRSRSGMTGAQAAERILQSQGIYDVAIQRVSGKLTDHYDPRNKTLNLSDAVYASTSVAVLRHMNADTRSSTQEVMHRCHFEAHSCRLPI